MCTAISYKCSDTYFGRNLDLDISYNECVVITPRNFKFEMRLTDSLFTRYAMIGMATVVEDYPLYYEATNEKGLSMAALNFPNNAFYRRADHRKDNVTPFEFIPWILGQCSTIYEAKELLNNINLVNVNFSSKLPLSPLHWMISDKEKSIAVESTKDAFTVYDNPFNVLTNSPPFHYHRTNLSNYMMLSSGPAHLSFDSSLPLENYSFGMGALGLPGDFSSVSRFVRAFFVKENSTCEKEEKDRVNQFFHIMNSVAMPKGCVKAEKGFEYTRYTSCCNADKGIYYYTTYDNFNITSVDMHSVDLNSENLYIFQL